MVSIKAYPEWIARDDLPNAEKPWEVTSGPPTRGDAWTDILNQRMRIPTINDEVSRAIRAHEMTHAKLSPAHGIVIPSQLADVPNAELLVRACEEARINFAAGDAGFDMSVLKDGSEKFAGERAAKHGDPGNIICDVIAMSNSGALKPYIAGIRKAVNAGQANPSTLQLANLVRKEVQKRTRAWIRDRRSVSTHPVLTDVKTPDGSIEVPANVGYLYATIRLAEDMARLMTRRREPASGEAIDTGDMPVSSTKGSFAVPIIDKLPLTERVAGRLGRKRIATNVGRDPRRINRMLTDPEHRVFDRRARSIGGVVLIDQSGSMHLDEDDLWSIIKASPGCVVIGYSHESRSVGVANIWVLADRGRVVSHIRGGNGGNGVDGPALKFALSKRRGREPFIWVCDGYVTDCYDDSRPHLDSICIDIVKRNGIHMVHDVTGAIDALKRVGRGEALKTRLVGSLSK